MNYKFQLRNEDIFCYPFHNERMLKEGGQQKGKEGLRMALP